MFLWRWLKEWKRRRRLQRDLLKVKEILEIRMEVMEQVLNECIGKEEE